MVTFNALAQVAALGGIVLLQTVYLIFLARLLGVEDFGRFSLALSITQIFLIGCDLGLHNTAVRRIAASPEDSPRLFSTFFRLKALLSGVLFLIMALIAFLLRETQATRLLLLLFAGGMVVRSMNLVLNVTYQAHGKLYLASAIAFLVSLFEVGLGLGALALGGRLPALGVTYIVAGVLGFLISLQLFPRHIHPFRLLPTRDGRQFIRESLPVGLGTLFNNAAGRIDLSLLSLLSGSYATGLYAAASRITSTLGNLPIGIFSAVLPALAGSGTDRRRIRRIFTRSAQVMLLLSASLTVLLFIYARTLMRFLYGSDYLEAVPLLRILVWSLLPLFTGMAFSHVILSQATLLRFLPVVTGLGLLLNVGLNLLLIPSLGAEGAAWSRVATEVLLALCYGVAAGRFLFAETGEGQGGRAD